MDSVNWESRMSCRNDMATRLIHLTRGANSDDEDDAFENLWKILIDKKLNGGCGFINGDRNAVCFQELPLNALTENLNYEKTLNGRVRYSSFGIRFQKRFIYEKGGRPVIYEDNEVAKAMLPENEYWRIVDLNLSNKDHYIDWTHEREWRVPDELQFDYKNIEVIVKNGKYFRLLVQRCIEKERKDILMGIHGIITLSSIYL